MPKAAAKPKKRSRYPRPDTWQERARKGLPGPPAERLKIKGDWTEAVRKALRKGKPG